MKFSPSRKCFYPEDLIEEYIIAGSLPEDLIDVTSHEVDMHFFTQEPEGKMLGSKNGRPSWVDLPEKTPEQIIAGVTSSISELLAIATVKIAPLQDAVDLGMATEAETTSLTKWKTYRVLVNRATSQSGFPANIDWPAMPE